MPIFKYLIAQSFQKFTGWKPKYNFEKTMTDLLNYWREEIRNNVDVTSN